MFGIRVLIYLVGIGLLVWILFRLARKPKIGTRSAGKVDEMVQCAHCGTYVPRKEAVQQNDRFYCCEEHRERGR
jgi:uncharacterized protein